MKKRIYVCRKSFLKNKKILFELEASVVEDEKVLGDLAKKVEKLRMILGQVAVRGEGVIVTLDDGTVDSNASDISSYIVHEQHVLNVVNELFISLCMRQSR